MTGVSDAYEFFWCTGCSGTAAWTTRSHLIFPVWKSTSYNTQRCSSTGWLMSPPVMGPPSDRARYVPTAFNVGDGCLTLMAVTTKT